MISEDVLPMEFHFQDIGREMDELVTAAELHAHLESGYPFSRKEFCEFLGVGESTLSGWLKDDRVPRFARVAFGLLLTAKKLESVVRELRRTEQVVVKSGGTYQICSLGRNDHGDMVGQVIAQDIPSFDIAYRLAGSARSLRILNECTHQIEYALSMSENPRFLEMSERLQESLSEHVQKSLSYKNWSDDQQARADVLSKSMDEMMTKL